VGSSAESVAVADLNGDGRMDVVVGTSSSNLAVLLADATGDLILDASIAVQGRPLDLQIADLDLDGHLDVTATLDFVEKAVVLRVGICPKVAVAPAPLGTLPVAQWTATLEDTVDHSPLKKPPLLAGSPVHSLSMF
jgi:hypothetical protein